VIRVAFAFQRYSNNTSRNQPIENNHEILSQIRKWTPINYVAFCDLKLWLLTKLIYIYTEYSLRSISYIVIGKTRVIAFFRVHFLLVSESNPPLKKNHFIPKSKEILFFSLNSLTCSCSSHLKGLSVCSFNYMHTGYKKINRICFMLLHPILIVLFAQGQLLLSSSRSIQKIVIYFLIWKIDYYQVWPRKDQTKDLRFPIKAQGLNLLVLVDHKHLSLNKNNFSLNLD